MAVKAYCGVMGSGKTYEVVTVPIYNALRLGRRVVSNVAGLNFEAMERDLKAEGCENIGTIFHVSHDDVKKPDFWLTDDKDTELSVIQPGDLVVLDEVWRFWDGFGPGSKEQGRRPPGFMNFIRMHRQFPHPKTGITCDVIFISQDIGDLHRSVRAVVEETYSMRKMIHVGKPEAYRIDIFTKGKTTGAPLRQLFGEYNPAKFDYYKSHAKAAADVDPRELNADDRGNVRKTKYYKFVKLGVPAFLVVGAVVVFIAWRALGAGGKVEKTEPVPASASAPAAPAVHQPPVSGETVVGTIDRDGFTVVMLTNGQRVRYIVGPLTIKRSALTTELLMPDGSVATNWGAVR